MYFAKDEIITLNDKKKYLILDTSLIDDNVYYKIREVNKQETEVIGKDLYITTINQDGKIYINDKLTLEAIEEIKESFNK